MVSGSVRLGAKPSLSKHAKKAGTGAGGLGGGKMNKWGKKKKKHKKKSHRAPTKKQMEAIAARPPGIQTFGKWKQLRTTKYFKRRTKYDPAWRPGRPYSDSYWTLGDANANFGPPGGTLDRSVLKVLSYRHTIVAPAYISAALTKEIDTSLMIPRPVPATVPVPAPARPVPALAAIPTKPQVLVLNPEYEPGVARFSVIILRGAFVDAQNTRVMRAALSKLEDADTTNRQAIAGLSSGGYNPQSSYHAVRAFRAACGPLGNAISKRLHYIDRQMIDQQNIMPDAVKALRRLRTQGYPSRTFPDQDDQLRNVEGPMQLATSVGVARGWGMTTFPGDCAELYSFISPLCPAHIKFDDLGEADLDAGDVVAILASEVATALTLHPGEGETGYAVMGWTEDRVVRHIEYEEWLRKGDTAE